MLHANSQCSAQSTFFTASLLMTSNVCSNDSHTYKNVYSSGFDLSIGVFFFFCEISEIDNAARYLKV